MASSGRYSKPPGGETTYNLFSWGNEGEPEKIRSGRSSVRNSAYQMGSQIVFGEESLDEHPKKRPGSDRKLQELSGSGIFQSGPVTVSSNLFASNNDQNNGNVITERPSVRLHQPAGGISQIVFGDSKPEPLKKMVSPMKQKELIGTGEAKEETPTRKPVGERKVQELVGTADMFTPLPEPTPPKEKPVLGFSASSDEVKPRNSPKPVGGVSQIVFGDSDKPIPLEVKRVSEKKLADLMGTGEYKGETTVLHVSDAKIRELKGCDIFKDEQPVIRDSLGGIRQPPGGESSIALI